MSNKTETVREQKPAKTVKVSTLIKGFAIALALVGAYIFGSQTAIQNNNRYNQDVTLQAQNLVKSLK